MARRPAGAGSRVSRQMPAAPNESPAPPAPGRGQRARIVIVAALALAAIAALLVVVAAFGGSDGPSLNAAGPPRPGRAAHPGARRQRGGGGRARSRATGDRDLPLHALPGHLSAHRRRSPRRSTGGARAEGHRRSVLQRRSPGRHAPVRPGLPRAPPAHRPDALHPRHGIGAASPLEELADRRPERRGHRLDPLGARGPGGSRRTPGRLLAAGLPIDVGDLAADIRSLTG